MHILDGCKYLKMTETSSIHESRVYYLKITQPSSIHESRVYYLKITQPSSIHESRVYYLQITQPSSIHESRVYYLKMTKPRGFNCSVNISENCDLDHNMTPLHNCIAFYLKYIFVGIYILNEKV